MSRRKPKKKKKTQKKKLPRLVVPARPRRPITLNKGKQYLQEASRYPLYKCWVGASWEAAGITTVVVSRSLPKGEMLAGVFLVDLYCLGVKDAYWRVYPSVRRLERTIEQLGKMHEGMLECDADFAHEMIYGAVEFAAQYDLHPHKDFQETRLVLDPPDAHPRTHNITFGKNGQPHYFVGPYDDPFFVQRVLNTLKRTAGDKFTCVVPLQMDELPDEE